MCILLRANVFIIVEILPWRALDTGEKGPASKHPSSSASACAGGYVTHWERDLVNPDSRRCLGVNARAAAQMQVRVDAHAPGAALSPHVVFFIASEENNESPEDKKYDGKNK